MLKNIAENTKTLENTKENILELERSGYSISPVSKCNGKGKVIRYNSIRGVYWFSSSRSAHMADCYFTRQRTETLYYFG